MKNLSTSFLLLLFTFAAAPFLAQINSLEIKPEREKMFTPYMYARHNGPEGLADFKKNSPHEYLKELWYYSESFYVKRDYFPDGFRLEESYVDISRFENQRKETDEAVVILPGHKDVVILKPENKLLYKPKN